MSLLSFLATGLCVSLALLLAALTLIALGSLAYALVGTVWMVVAMVRGVVVPEARARDRYRNALRDTW